jgi:hypothetical protein
MNKTISIPALVLLSFALFFPYTNSGLIFAQNQSSASSTANNKTSSQNQTIPTSQTMSAQTQPGSIGQGGQSQSHSGQSQSQSGPVGQSGQALSGQSGQGLSGQSGQTPLEKQIDQQNQINQQNQTGRFPKDSNYSQTPNQTP